MKREPIPEADLELIVEALDEIAEVIVKAQETNSAKLRVACCRAVQDETFAIITHMTIGMVIPPPMWTKEPVKALLEAVTFLSDSTDKALDSSAEWDLACEAVSESAIRLRDALRTR